MELKIEKYLVEKMLMKLIPKQILEGHVITRIEADYNGDIKIHMKEKEESEGE